MGDVGRGIVYEIDPTTGSSHQLTAKFARPTSLATAATYRTLFVGDAGSGKVYVFRLENSAFKQAEAIPTVLRALSMVTTGPDNTIFIGDGVSSYQLSLKTKKLTRFAVQRVTPPTSPHPARDVSNGRRAKS